MSRARLYLDVDGVLNADMPYGWDKEQRHQAKVCGYTIRWAGDLIERINALDVDIWWATTWRSSAVEYLEYHIPIKSVGVIHPGLNPDAPLIWPSIAWKTEAILMHQAESPSRFIHADDEIYDVESWASTVFDIGGLPICPESWRGLSPKELERMENYLS